MGIDLLIHNIGQLATLAGSPGLRRGAAMRAPCRCRVFCFIVPVDHVRYFRLLDIQHSQKAGWRHNRNTLERTKGKQILIAADDHLGVAADG